jgi:ABC-type antimicrobial peptide transport system permease subunit
MTSRKLLIQTLLYHWRSHVAVLLCVAVGTSVLCGALLVGDSMRGSLRDITLDRLGGIDFGVSSDRLFGRDLAQRFHAAANSCWEPSNSQSSVSLPALMLRASIVRVDQSDHTADRAGGVQLCGVTKQFWNLNRSGTAPSWTAEWDNPNSSDSIAINEQLARELHAATGDTLLVRLEKPSEIPREAVLGRKDDQLITLRLTVSCIVTTDEFGNFKLDATQRAPRNAFLPLDRLASAVGHADQANTIVVSVPELNRSDSNIAPAKTASILSCLQKALGSVSQLDDYGLQLRTDTTGDTISLESRRMVLEPAVVDAAARAATETAISATPVLVYLANSIRAETETEQPRTIPYSTIAALPLDDPSIASQFEFRDGRIPDDPTDDSILLNTWAADDLQCNVGDQITIDYYVAEPSQPFQTAEATFHVRGIVEINGIAADQGLVPEYPGITNAKRYADWDPPFPMDLKRIRPRDEEYWDKYRATPKAFVSLAVGERLWGSRFGTWTSMRFELAARVIAPDAPRPTHPISPGLAMLDQNLLQGLDPAQFGLAIRPVRADGLAASAGGTDFGGLFIGFSFFLIVSAAILIGLVFRLGVERRGKQVGLLLAVGHSRGGVRNLLVAEGLLVAVLGTVVGLAGAAGYAWLVMAGLRTWWFAAVGTSLLRLHVSWVTLGVGLVASILLAALAIVLALRGITRSAPRTLMGGNVSDWSKSTGGPIRYVRVVIGGLVVVGTICVFAFGSDLQKNAPERFFVLGAIVLLALLGWLGTLVYGEGRSVRGRGAWAIARLGIRNAARNRTRTMLTVGLVAFATFVIVAVGANRRDESSTQSLMSGGWLVGESSVPLLYDLNTKDGRRDLGLPDDNDFWMNGVHVYRFRVKEGEDASCLNLYQPKRPRILGVSEDTLEQVYEVIGGSRADFHRSSQQQRADFLRSSKQEEDLLRDLGPDIIPAIGDANSVKWILHLGLGERLAITAEDGRTVSLQIVALLDRSVFQSELIISESNFQRLFPSQVGYSVFLVSQAGGVQLSTLLEEHLSDYGFDVTPVSERVAEYHAVENTYLATFQMLGGLGLMLGTLGLGAVVLRGVIERRGELALLMAVGYRSIALAWLVLAETAYLLVVGLAVGTVSAIVAVAPHLLSSGVEVPFGSLAGTLFLVLAVGLLSSIAAVLATLRTPLLPALRSE